jgi:DNA-binding LytR/AlgR family response regulator
MTSHENYMAEAFGRNVYNFLVKPVDTSVLHEELEKIWNNMSFSPILETGVEEVPYIQLITFFIFHTKKTIPLQIPQILTFF